MDATEPETATMNRDECLRILELDAAATAADIESAYSELVQIWNLDRVGGSLILRSRVEAKLATLHEAHQALRTFPVAPDSFPEMEAPASSEPDSASWYYARNRVIHGPIWRWQLTEMAASAELKPNDLVWHECLEVWVAAVQIKGLVFCDPVVTSRLAANSLTGKLKVAVRELKSAFRLLAANELSGPSLVGLEFTEGKLIVGFDAMRIGIPATGRWQGIAVVSSWYVSRFGEHDFRRKRNATITYGDNHIAIDEERDSCLWIGK